MDFVWLGLRSREGSILDNGEEQASFLYSSIHLGVKRLKIYSSTHLGVWVGIYPRVRLTIFFFFTHSATSTRQIFGAQIPVPPLAFK